MIAYLAIGCIGVLIGSFINVLVYRIPRHESIAYPASHCPQCGHPLLAIENIPIISWLVLRGKCSSCQEPISWRYPAVEISTGVLSGVVAWQWGLHWSVVPALLLTWVLLTVSLIDFNTYLIPDKITKPGILVGLAINASAFFSGLHFNLTSPMNAIFGVILGYGVLWALATGYWKMTGRHGMGGGDLKLLGLIGAFLGWESTYIALFIAAITGGIMGIALLLSGKGRNYAIPFGPYLALGGLVAMLWSHIIIHEYWHIMGV